MPTAPIAGITPPIAHHSTPSAESVTFELAPDKTYFDMKIPGHKGFTLVELMVTVAILAIVLAIAVPSFQGLIRDQQATTVANEVVSAIALARSEAIKRNRNVTVCRRNAAGTDCDSGTNWAAGWAVVDGSLAVGARAIRVWSPPPGAASVSTAATSITFNAQGRRDVTANACVAISVTSGGETSARSVTVVPGGAYSAKKGGC